MPSLADIPDRLLAGSLKTDFLLWLASIPIDTATRHALMHIWTKATDTPFTLAQASCFARPTGFVKPGLFPETSPWVACL